MVRLGATAIAVWLFGSSCESSPNSNHPEKQHFRLLILTTNNLIVHVRLSFKAIDLIRETSIQTNDVARIVEALR